MDGVMQFGEVLTRRTEVSELVLAELITMMNMQFHRSSTRAAELRARAEREQREFESGRVATEAELHGRVSGSEDWRRARGELGESTGSCTVPNGLPSLTEGLEMLAQCVQSVWYSSASDDAFGSVALVGRASRSGALVQLTPAANDCIGAMWLPRKQLLLHVGFMAEFEFSITRSGADGMAFVIVRKHSQPAT